MEFVEDLDLPVVVVTDNQGRSLPCYVEHSLQLDEESYVILQPVDIPVYVFAWLDEEGDEPTVVEEEEHLKAVYPHAQAVLEEQNIKLHWSAFTLTVSGEIPEVDEEDYDDYGYDAQDENGMSSAQETFQLLAEFCYDDQDYAVCTPLDPVLIVARMEQGEAQVLEGEELDAIQPFLESYLSSQLDLEHMDDEDLDEEES